jgi:superfamily II DNA or RNA helicase
MMAITAYYKKRTLIITPTKKLVKEMVDKFKEFTNYTP